MPFLSSRTVPRHIPFNCLGGHRPAAYKSINYRDFESALRCPRALNPAPPNLPGRDRLCTCPRCRDWIIRDGRRILIQPLLGLNFGLRPRKVLEEAARDGVHWYLVAYWECVNLDWVPSYLKSSFPEWPEEGLEPVDITPMASVNRTFEPIHWFWILLDHLVCLSRCNLWICN